MHVSVLHSFVCMCIHTHIYMYYVRMYVYVYMLHAYMHTTGNVAIYIYMQNNFRDQRPQSQRVQLIPESLWDQPTSWFQEAEAGEGDREDFLQ